MTEKPGKLLDDLFGRFANGNANPGDTTGIDVERD
jgi:hypothetical protein